jgi:hypothetical protein
MAQRETPTAADPRWLLGIAFPIVIAAACGIVGTMVHLRLVSTAHLYCVGDMSISDRIGKIGWVATRVVLFPVVSVLSAIAAVPFSLLARLPALAGRPTVQAVLLGLTIMVPFAGPVAFTLYDLAAETPDDCALPPLPFWLPA